MVGSIPNDVFQFSTYAALTEGFNTGQPRTADLTSHGTDGIGVYEDGTFMILLDQNAYQIRKDGTVVPGPQNARLPFAMVTIYQSTVRIKIPSLSFEGLNDLISSSELGPAKAINTLTPFKLTAIFASIALEQGGSQTSIMGTIFGFIIPKWMRDISGPRVHAHFLDEDDTKGGQVTDFEIEEEVTLTFAKCGRFHLGFPQGPEWEDVKLSRE
ncbi:alpha-acetolactate decarboxylase [Paraphoma chrysanthemicola]|nr:alpha-acetolactate decarboxylase [Paraphoma chrysanthemicola]